MQVVTTSFTIAEYCYQMQAKAIIVNPDYQRSPRVWPPAARSYLIETILLGYPLPKLSLYQHTNLQTKKTVKEIVDGQQRSKAIYDFFSDNFRITGHGPFGGKLLSQLNDDERGRFLTYPLAVDLLVSATASNIREMFRRINSYTVPLNPQERRHAIYQGKFKFFIVDLVGRYADTLKTIGVFTERQLSRMADASLFSEIAYALSKGIDHASQAKLNSYYSEHEERFPESEALRNRIERALDAVIMWTDIHESALMRSYNFYSLILAISHAQDPLAQVNSNTVYPRDRPISVDESIAVSNLTLLAAALEDPERFPQFSEYVAACAKATTRKFPRERRFYWLSKALDPHLMP